VIDIKINFIMFFYWHISSAFFLSLFLRNIFLLLTYTFKKYHRLNTMRHWTVEQIQALINARRDTNIVNTFYLFKDKFNSVNIYCNLFRRTIICLVHQEENIGITSRIPYKKCVYGNSTFCIRLCIQKKRTNSVSQTCNMFVIFQ
jgi:hypothetical protein